MNKETKEIYNDQTEGLIEWLLDEGADRILVVDEFSNRCGLDMPLNDLCTGDMLEIATLETEDSGYAPALWVLALSVLKQRRAALSQSEGDA